MASNEELECPHCETSENMAIVAPGVCIMFAHVDEETGVVDEWNVLYEPEVKLGLRDMRLKCLECGNEYKVFAETKDGLPVRIIGVGEVV